jgi:hypothetical protein
MKATTIFGLTNPISQDNAVLNSRNTLTTDLEMIWKEEVKGLFEVISRSLSGGTEKITKNLSADSGGPSRDLNRVSPKQKSIALRLETTYWVPQP